MSEVPLIAHVIHRFDVGGLENGLVNLINNIPDSTYRHVIVTMDGFNPEFAKRLNKNVPIYSVDKAPGKDIGVYFRLWTLFRDIKPDIVHTRNLSGIEAQVPAFFAGVSSRIHSEHGWDIHDPKGDVKKYQLIRRVIGVLIQRFIPLSSELESYLINKVGISSGKVNRICNGVSLARFMNDGTHDVPNFPFNENDIVLGCVGRLELIKGHSFLIQAFAHLLASNPSYRANVRLCIVGEGSERAKLEELINEHNLTELCWLPGARADVPAIMSKFDVFILPSLAEGISNTILEAMAAGLPVVATDVGGNGDLVSNGTTGQIIASQNPEEMALAIRDYIEQPTLALSQGEAGKKLATENFSLDTMVEKYTTVYHSVL